MSAPQEGAIGVEIVFTVVDGNGAPVNLSSATTKDLIFYKPDKTKVTKPALFAPPPLGTGTGTDGKLIYTTTAGDLSPHGTWKTQAAIVKPGLDSKTKVQIFDVLKNL